MSEDGASDAEMQRPSTAFLLILQTEFVLMKEKISQYSDIICIHLYSHVRYL